MKDHATTRDVLIIGGGLAGLTLALQLKRENPDRSITIFEKHYFPAPEAAHKVGESTVEVASHYFSSVLGLDDHLKAEQLPKLGLRVFFQNANSTHPEDRLELGSNQFFPRRTFQLDRGRLENYLARLVQDLGVELIEGTLVREIQSGSNSTPHTVIAETRGDSAAEKPNPEESTSAATEATATIERSGAWLIDATGRSALLRKKLGLAKPCQHQINSVWFRLKSELNIDTWSKAPSWTAYNHGRTSRWFSTNHLIGTGYWVWIIPLSSGATSIGIVSDPRFHPLEEQNSFPLALNWLKRFEPQCGEAVAAESDKLMDFLALKHFSKESTALISGDRWAFTGDSGVFIDPLYSPGSDYIAFANTLICDLVARERRGKKVGELARTYNDILLLFAENTFLAYQDQYQIFGNSAVMPIKILWDYAVYWAFFAFLFTQNKLTDISLLGMLRDELTQLSQQNRSMQEFFRTWNSLESRPVSRSFIDIAEIPGYLELNYKMTRPLSDEEAETELKKNLAWVTQLNNEIRWRASQSTPGLHGSASPTSSSILQETWAKLFGTAEIASTCPAPDCMHQTV